MDKKRILFVTSEAVPFIKTGGLVARALSRDFSWKASTEKYQWMCGEMLRR